MFTDFSDWDQFIDEISGKALNTTLVEKARAEEIAIAKKYHLYDKVSIDECWSTTGKGPLGVRWIDLNKGDEESPEYRCRLVCQEVRISVMQKWFAATPPLECLKYFASKQRTGGRSRWAVMIFIDVVRAHWRAKATRPLFINLPPEDAEEGKCGKLNFSMYSTKDAAYNWELEFTDVRFDIIIVA